MNFIEAMLSLRYFRHPSFCAVDSFQVFIDHSVVEIYSGNSQNVATFRVYPTLSDALGISLVSLNADVVFNVNAWPLGRPSSDLSAFYPPQSP